MNRNIPKIFNVLVFPGGTENGLEIYRSLRWCKEVKIYSASSNVPNHAEYVFENHGVIPDISAPECLRALNRLLLRWKIDYIYPANPLVIDFLNVNRESLAADVILPPREVVDIVRSKIRTYKVFSELLPVPAIYAGDDEVKLPACSKPDRLYGEQGFKIIKSKTELSMCRNIEGSFLCEYLPGREYSVDCFSTKLGVLYCQARTRGRIRMGTSMTSHFMPKRFQSKVRDYAEIIFSRLKIEGAWFFQLKEDFAGQLKLLEVEPKIAGTMALSRVVGVNMALLSILNKAGVPVEVCASNLDVTIDRSLQNSYRHKLQFNTVYVDLDDTLIVHGRVNTELVRFLYQCVNAGRKIVLLSKSLHRNKLLFLKKHRLHSLFDRVHWLKEHQSKSEYIADPESIFIDDSFSQRVEVMRRNNIPVFDPSMVELLLDERLG